ncbi:MCE family protein [Pseudonocardia sp. GCM10023141]|uniref:MCE family protein n=1 Tax=Pseudonocardia sp. GCM10023141 TaxID=3252653 RepID=UPI00361719A8
MTGMKNPLLLGGIGVVVIAVLLVAALVVPQVSFNARTDDFTAQFSNAAGLAGDAQVLVAGVPAGRVTRVSLAGDHVDVAFRLDKGQSLGDRSLAAIKLQTILGRRFLAITPAGGNLLPAGGVIPVERTQVPYDIGTLSRAASDTIGGLDTTKLQSMITTLSDVIPSDPKLVGGALDGVAGASKLLASRNEGFQQLLKGAKSVSDLLVGQQASIAQLLDNGNVVAQFLVDERDALHALLVDVQNLTRSVNTLLHDTQGELGPLIDRLDKVAGLLADNEKSISDLLVTAAPAVRYVANASGNGPWVDLSGPALVLPDNVLCVAGLAQGCR